MYKIVNKNNSVTHRIHNVYYGTYGSLIQTTYHK